MLTIEVVAIEGVPPPIPISARFSADGGSIGRDSSCTLVLPDVEKRISRRHAQIMWRDGQFTLRNQGSAIAVMVNGTPLEYGADIVLAGGDRIDIGEFALQIHSEPAKAPAVAARVESSTRRTAPAAADDVLAGFGPASSASDPFADLIPNPASARPLPTPAARGVATASAPRSSPLSGQLPDDFDPFGEPAPAPDPNPTARPRGDAATSAIWCPREQRASMNCSVCAVGVIRFRPTIRSLRRALLRRRGRWASTTCFAPACRRRLPQHAVLSCPRSATMRPNSAHRCACHTARLTRRLKIARRRPHWNRPREELLLAAA